MSVPKPKRKQSQFEVFHNWYKLRRELTDLLLRDFGYSQHKFTKKLNKRFGNIPYEEMSDVDKATFDRYMIRCESFDDWFVVEARTVVMNCLRQVTAHLFAANSIYPTYYEELVARGFKLIQNSDKEVNIEGDWAGTIHAARSSLVMGQTKKIMYGRFLAKLVTMHQESRIYRVDFAPINPSANLAGVYQVDFDLNAQSTNFALR